MYLFRRWRLYFLAELLWPVPRRERARRLVEDAWRREGRVAQFRICGNSMREFKGGESVRIQFLENVEYRSGELILVRRAEDRLIHMYCAGWLGIVIERGTANDYHGIHLRTSVIGKVILGDSAIIEPVTDLPVSQGNN